MNHNKSIPELTAAEIRQDSTETHSFEFCERDCIKYARIREDYENLLVEVHELRHRLGLVVDFTPSNEASESFRREAEIRKKIDKGLKHADVEFLLIQLDSTRAQIVAEREIWLQRLSDATASFVGDSSP